MTCKRCLLHELDKASYAGIYEYISGLPAEIRADKTEQDRRISICLSCVHCVNAMCRLCGCFIEIRAAKKIMECPDNNW